MLSFAHYPILPLLAAAAVALNDLPGEAHCYHPLVGFGLPPVDGWVWLETALKTFSG
ncbi:MAG: hypothetical protein ABI475_08670 [Methylophilaceae bacterium]